jgi:hypothetical protein
MNTILKLLLLTGTTSAQSIMEVPEQAGPIAPITPKTDMVFDCIDDESVRLKRILDSKDRVLLTARMSYDEA